MEWTLLGATSIDVVAMQLVFEFRRQCIADFPEPSLEVPCWYIKLGLQISAETVRSQNMKIGLGRSI